MNGLRSFAVKFDAIIFVSDFLNRDAQTMNRYAQIARTLILTVSLSGCVIAIGTDSFDKERDWQERQERNSAYIQYLQLGQSMGRIETDLGTPDFSESFHRDGDIFDVLYYRTQRVHNDSKTSMDETTPLVFVERELVGWGQSAVDKATP